MKKKYNVIALLALAGCAPLVKPTQMDAERANQRWSGTDLAALEYGRTIYAEKCGTCHKLFAPGDFTEKKWSHELPKMAPNSKLTDEQYQAVERYLFTMAKPASN